MFTRLQHQQRFYMKVSKASPFMVSSKSCISKVVSSNFSSKVDSQWNTNFLCAHKWNTTFRKESSFSIFQQVLGQSRFYSKVSPQENQKLSILIHGHTIEAINTAILLAPYHKVTLTFDDIPFDEMPVILLPPQVPFYFETRYKDVYDTYYEMMHPIREIRARTFKNSTLFDFDIEQLNKGGTINFGTEFASVHQQVFFKHMKDLLRQKKLFLREKKLRSLRETKDGVYVRFSGASSGEERYDYVIGADGAQSKVKNLRWPDQTLPVNVNLLQEHNDYITIGAILKNNDVEYADILYDLWHPHTQMQFFSTVNQDDQPRIGILARIKMPGGQSRQYKLQMEIASILSHILGQTFNDNGADIILDSLKRIASSSKVPPDTFQGVILPPPNVAYEQLTSDRVALIGSAAHVSTPILGIQNLVNFYDAQKLSTILNEGIYTNQKPNLKEFEKASLAFHDSIRKKSNGLFKYFGTFSNFGYNLRMKVYGKSNIKSAYNHALTANIEK